MGRGGIKIRGIMNGREGGVFLETVRRNRSITCTGIRDGGNMCASFGPIFKRKKGGGEKGGRKRESKTTYYEREAANMETGGIRFKFRFCNLIYFRT